MSDAKFFAFVFFYTRGQFVVKSLGKHLNNIDFFEFKSIMTLNLFRNNNKVKGLN